ncbi:hypothetical protein J1614_001372 [Plenodomus biglobosus]|nr:hypothetical protein J1614_001372 [Plenodomus biglobosus]
MDPIQPTPRSEDEALAMNTSIRQLMLTDPAAITEFHRRRATFGADTSILPSIRARGLAVFDNALQVDLPAVMNEGQPAVRLLRTVIRILGAFYQENQERLEEGESPFQRQDQESDHEDSDEDDVELLDTEEHQSGPSSERALQRTKRGMGLAARAGLDKTTSKQSQQPAALALNARMARRKQRKTAVAAADEPSSSQETASQTSTDDLMTTATSSAIVPSTPVPASAQSRSMRPRTQQHATHHTFLASPSNTSHPASSSTLSLNPYMRPTTTHDPTTGGPSLIVKLPFSALSSQPLFRPMAQQHSTVSRRSMKRRRDFGPTSRRSPKKKKTDVDKATEKGKGKPQYEDKIDDVDENMEYNTSNRHTRPYKKRATDRGGRGYKSHVTIPSDSDSNVEPHMAAPPSTPDDISHSPTKASSTTSPPASPNHSSPSPYPSASPPPPPPPSPLTLLLPPYPPIPLKSLSPFHRGATIALENILEESMASPARSLRDIVMQLEAEMPLVGDWEHVVVLEGGGMGL